VAHDDWGCDMKLLIESLMIFFGTLRAAGLVALGEPAGAELAIIKAMSPDAASGQQHGPQPNGAPGRR
jgi:hypothetical protein